MTDPEWVEKVGDYGNCSYLWLNYGNYKDGGLAVGGRFARFKLKSDKRAAKELLLEAANGLEYGCAHRVMTDYDRMIAKAWAEEVDDD